MALAPAERDHLAWLEDAARATALGDHGRARDRHRKRLLAVAGSTDTGLTDDVVRDLLASQAASLHDVTPAQVKLDAPSSAFAGVDVAAVWANAAAELRIPTDLGINTAPMRRPRTPERSVVPERARHRAEPLPAPPAAPQNQPLVEDLVNTIQAPKRPPPVDTAPQCAAGSPVDMTSSTLATAAQPAAGGFVTAQQQLQIDVKAGRAVAPQPRRVGLRRQPAPPPQPASAPTAAGTGSGGGGLPVDAVTAAAVGNGKAAKKAADEGDNDDSDFPDSLRNPDGSIPEKLGNLDPKLVAQIASEILEVGGCVTWDDVAGLEYARAEVDEAIVWPLARPDLFHGIRDPPRGLLLFGPPGTGKTMIARAIAGASECTFMNVSASSLMSKWIGDGEKMVRCMFAVACVKQPTVIFIDEIDSLLSMRSEGEQDAIRRVKTEFLVHFDGVGSSSSDRILIIGATNRPEELDEAARRRMEKRLYIPLPDTRARGILWKRLLSTCSHALTPEDFDSLAGKTEGYSGADIKLVARDAAFGPIRDKGLQIKTVDADDVRPVNKRDCLVAIKKNRPSVAPSEITRYAAFNQQFGSFGGTGDSDLSDLDDAAA